MATIAIPLTKGKYALIDEEDLPLVGHLRWHARCDGRDETRTCYAARCGEVTNLETGTRAVVFMHRVILAAPNGLLVDHINGDGLDNRRANLRLATAQDNAANRHRGVGRSRFRGVVWDAKTEKWVASIKRDGKSESLGYFTHEDEAARVYDEAARRIHGEFASLNFPEPSDVPQPVAVMDRHTKTSGFRGVHWERKKRLWVATITVNRQRKNLGLFRKEIDAAIAYDAAAVEMLGNRARINFPEVSCA